MKFDVIVIGAGAAGQTAALEAARHGAKVLAVDPFSADEGASRTGAAPLARLRDLALRGVWLRASAAPAEGLRQLAQRLLATRRARAGVDAAASRKRLIDAGVRVESGLGVVTGANQVRVGATALHEAETILLAPGSRPRRPERFPWASGVVCDSETLLALDRLPRSLLVLGAEEEGCELAAVLAALGVQVTLIERRRKLFRLADRDVLEHLHHGFQKLGVTVATEEGIESVEPRGDGSQRHALVRLTSGRVEACEKMLILAGRVPRFEGLGLEPLGVERDARGFVSVDENGRTSLPSVYACGDATGPPFRIGTAVWQARAAISAALHGASVSPPELPMAVHTIPQIATVGLGEDLCRLLGRETLVGCASERDLLVPGLPTDPVRLLKLIFDRSSAQLLGVQIAGGAATELIHVASLLLTRSAKAEDLAGLILHHPAQCDAFRAAALNALTRSGHGAKQLSAPAPPA
jgi:NAD(P) transhydrogenase